MHTVRYLTKIFVKPKPYTSVLLPTSVDELPLRFCCAKQPLCALRLEDRRGALLRGLTSRSVSHAHRFSSHATCPAPASDKHTLLGHRAPPHASSSHMSSPPPSSMKPVVPRRAARHGATEFISWTWEMVNDGHENIHWSADAYPTLPHPTPPCPAPPCPTLPHPAPPCPTLPHPDTP